MDTPDLRRVKLSLERKITYGFAAAVVVLVLVAAVALWNVRWFYGTAYWVTHTHTTLNRLEHALVDVLSMESSARGFAPTT